MYLRNIVIDAVNEQFILITPTENIPLLHYEGLVLLLEKNTTFSERAGALAIKLKVPFFVVERGGIKLIAYVANSTPNYLTKQIRIVDDPVTKLYCCHKLYAMRFTKKYSSHRSISTLRGSEGGQVRQKYRLLAKKYNVPWHGRKRSLRWNEQDSINKAISIGNHCLYNLTEIAVLSAGYNPYLGFFHSSKGRKRQGKSLVYDIADVVKFTTVVPLAFQVVAYSERSVEFRMRAMCARLFKASDLITRLINITNEVMDDSYQLLTKDTSNRRSLSLP